MSKNISVYGILSSEAQVSQCLDQLRGAGFRAEDISVLMPANVGNKDFAHEKDTKAPEGAATGGAVGGVLGTALGWLAGVGTLAIPGVGPLIAAGPIMAALAGAGAGAALGGATGALIGLGIPEYEAKRFEGRVRNGGILISVHCDNGDWADRAENVLKSAGAEEVSNSRQASADYEETDKPVPR